MHSPHRVASRLAFAFVAFASTFGVARLAHAQNVTLALSPTQPLPTWLDSTGAALPSQPPRSLAYNPYGISFSDCENDYGWRFAVAVTYAGSTEGVDSLQVWAGAEDCTRAANRTSATGGTCVPVTPPIVLSDVATNVTVYARDIAMAIGGVAPGGTASFSSAHASNEAACFRQVSSSAIPLGLYFLAFTNGGSSLDTALSYNAPAATAAVGSNGILIDLVGPLAPTGISLDSRDNAVEVSWSPSTDADTQGFQVFCAPSAAADAAAEPPIDAQCASWTTDIGADGGVIDSGVPGPCPASLDVDAGTCSSPLLAANGAIGSEIPTAYLCGLPISSTTVTSQLEANLTNGTDYAFGVAAYDAFQNLGALSVASPCADPDPTSANQAGGGGCAIDAVHTTTRATAIGGALALGALAYGRRRRHVKRRSRAR